MSKDNTRPECVVVSVKMLLIKSLVVMLVFVTTVEGQTLVCLLLVCHKNVSSGVFPLSHSSFVYCPRPQSALSQGHIWWCHCAAVSFRAHPKARSHICGCSQKHCLLEMLLRCRSWNLLMIRSNSRFTISVHSGFEGFFGNI